MESKHLSTDVAVVGGGLSGLAAAIYLARAGRDVTVFEKSSSVGGRAISQEHHGAMLNLGAHALYEKTPAVEVLKELGIPFTWGSPAGVRAMSGGKISLLPVDLTTLLKTDMLDPAAKWETARLLLKLQMMKPEALAGTTLREWLDREIRKPDVRRFIEGNARTATYTDAPDRISVGLAIEQLQSVAKGKVMYVDGGWQSLVDGMAQAAREAGAHIVTGARVDAVEQAEGSVKGVRLADGTVYDTGSVIIAAGPQDALRLVQGGDQTPLAEWAANATPVNAACLDVVLRRLPNPENKVVLNLDRPLFLTVQSEFCRIAPEGEVALHALKYLNPSEPHDADKDRADLENWLDQTQRGWRDEVIEARYLPHLTVMNALVTARQGGTAGRPGPAVPGVEGLYVAGDWVGPKGLLAAASLWSAKLAAGAVLSREAAPRVRIAA